MTETLTTLRKVGNSTGLNLNREVLQESGFKQGDSVQIRVLDKKRVEITEAENPLQAIDDAFEWVKGRYPQTLEDLAK